MMKIAMGADSYGLSLKKVVKEYLASKNYEMTDVGVMDSEDDTPYYQIADDIAKGISNKEFDRAILFCGTGMGMAIIANKHPGIYAAVCETPFTAEKSRSINNSNILTLGALIVTGTIANEIVEVWLNTEFTEGWSTSDQEWLRKSMDDISSFEHDQFGHRDVSA